MEMADLFEGGSLSAVLEIANRYKTTAINNTISPGDGGMSAPTESDYAHYWRDGQNAMELILSAMLAANKKDIRSILDMPCGYGRVARHLVAAFPSASLTVCDVDPDMIGFCAKEFGGEPIMSNYDLKKVSYPQMYDLIWCGSLLTHLPETKFRDALDLFSRSLAANGIAVVTLHGRYSLSYGRGTYVAPERFVVAERNYYKRGFGYVDYSDNPSPNFQNYGITLSSASYVMDAIGDDLTVRVMSFTERGWNNHQDVLVFKKTSII